MKEKKRVWYCEDCQKHFKVIDMGTYTEVLHVDPCPYCGSLNLRIPPLEIIEGGNTMKRLIIGLTVLIALGLPGLGAAWTSQEKYEIAQEARNLAITVIMEQWEGFIALSPRDARSWPEVLKRYKYKADTIEEINGPRMGWKGPAEMLTNGIRGDCEDVALLIIAGVWKYVPWIRTGLILIKTPEVDHMAAVLANDGLVEIVDLTNGFDKSVFAYDQYLRRYKLGYGGDNWFIIWFDGTIWNN